MGHGGSSFSWVVRVSAAIAPIISYLSWAWRCRLQLVAEVVSYTRGGCKENSELNIASKPEPFRQQVSRDIGGGGQPVNPGVQRSARAESQSSRDTPPPGAHAALAPSGGLEAGPDPEGSAL